MKNETARREIESLDYYLQNHTDDYSEESHTAMMMAVKALEQEPCEDVIRREDAINAVSEALEHVVVENEDVARKMMNKLPSVKPQEPCEDAISRQAVIEITAETGALETQARVKALPPVDPQPQTGHWIRELIRNEKGGCIGAKMICSKCGNDNKHDEYMNYCPNCGKKMDERREVRDKV